VTAGGQRPFPRRRPRRRPPPRPVFTSPISISGRSGSPSRTVIRQRSTLPAGRLPTRGDAQHLHLPGLHARSGAGVTVHSGGAGNDTATDLYWGGRGSPVWNNDGDLATLADANGTVVSTLER
ncbi:lamin tail domain-containing protein, partial [Methanoculleus chikugoensis]|uniref:lamin tail domain-containing protein n=1 Tax=Methanoculleus chikugoensis TaxID=118126 RepID=UPI001FB3B377